MTLHESDTIKIVSDVPAIKLKKGMIGAVVHIHTKPRLAYMIEFCDKWGRTNALYSLLPEQIEKADVSREEYLKYLEAGDLPYNPADTFCIDPNSSF